MEVSLVRHQSQLVTLPFTRTDIRHFFLVGGYGCVSGDTLLDTPTGKVRINNFNGGDIYSYNPVKGKVVIAKANKPKNLGNSKMVRIEFSNGNTMCCSLEHSFLCVDGNFRNVSELLAEYSSNHLLTNLEYDQLVQNEDVRHLNQTLEDFRVYYPRYLHLCDELLRSFGDIFQAFAPLQDDVQQHSPKDTSSLQELSSLSKQHLDVHQPKCNDNLFSLKACAHALCKDKQCEVWEQAYYAVLRYAEYIWYCYPLYQLPHDNKDLEKTTLLERLSRISLMAYDNTPIYIKTIATIGYYDKWDLTIPYYHNYISCGVISHNCGKSFSAVMLIIELARRYPKLKAGAMFGVASLSGVLFSTTIGNTVEAICKECGIRFRLDKRDNIMYVGTARFKIFNLEDYTSIAGYNFSAVLMDELDELPQSKAMGAYTACRERARVTLPDGREPFLVTTTTAQGKRGIYKIIQNLRREIGTDGQPTKVCVIHGRTKDNINNDPSYYEDLYKAYDETERKAFLDGEFVQLETGRVYPKYSSDNNDTEPFEVDDSESVFIGQDLNLGFSSACACVVREGIIYVVKCYSFEDIWLAPEQFRRDFPNNDIQWFPDSSSKDIFSLHGFKQQISQQDIRTRISTVNPSIIARTAMVNILLRQKRIQIFRNRSTSHLREGLDMRGFDAKGNPEKGEGKEAYDHITDAMEYVVFRLVQDREEFRDIRSLRFVGNHPTS